MEKERMFNILRGVIISSFLNQREKEELLNFVSELENKETERKWIPVEEQLPEDNKYILLSFENFTVPMIGRYETDEDGGAFYTGDEELTLCSYGLFVNAWMPLPEPYKEKE